MLNIADYYQNDLEFVLRLQEFIELCRKRDTGGAIAYSRKNLAAWALTHVKELQQGMTLLAFGERTGVDLYRVSLSYVELGTVQLNVKQGLYDNYRWGEIRDRFRATFLDLYALPSQSLLALSLSAGLATLRLPSCVPHTHSDPSESSKSPTIPLLPAAPPLHNLEQALGISEHLTAPVGGIPSSPSEDLHKHPEAPTGNIDCPTCGEYIKVLANEVPMSHHVNSTIVCRISGEVMDSDNVPLAFPNGYVYSSKVSSIC